jgi:O-antigen/teichoic acid export membrane protein
MNRGRIPDSSVSNATLSAMDASAQPGIAGTVRGRLIRGFGATALGPVVTAIIQLGTVPLLLHAWGAAKYGDWLLVSAVPSYLALSDMGFGTASGSDMTMRVAAGDREGALRTFQSSWALLTSVSIIMMLLASATVWWVPWQRWLKLSSVSSLQAAAIVTVLGAYVVVAQQNNVAESGYRCDGNFATGILWLTILRLIETVMTTVVALLGGSLLSVALTYLAARSLGSLGYGLLLRHKSPWLRFGIRHACLQTIKQMAAPALGFMAMPIGDALTLQGFTVVIGALLGPVAVVAFSTLRTLSRINFQLTSVVAHTLWPELSTAFGAGKISLARRLHRHAIQAALGLSVLGGLLFWLAGPFLYHIWIRKAVTFDAACFHVLLLAAIANSLWYGSSVVAMSANAHHRIMFAYLAGSSISVGLAGVLIHPLGIVGAALALLLINVSMSGLVLQTALRQVHDTLREFVVAMFVLPPVGRAWRQAREA